jgi:hypothetical protein
MTFLFIGCRALRVATNGIQLGDGGLSEHFIVNQAETLIEAQSLIKPLNRHFWVGAVSGSLFSVFPVF